MCTAGPTKADPKGKEFSKTLGLDDASSMGVNLSNLYSDCDLRAHEASRSVAASLFALDKLPAALFEPIDSNCCSNGPFEQLFAALSDALFDAQWTRRHGATVGLRELLRNRSVSLGVALVSSTSASASASASESQSLGHTLLLEELACRLVLLVSLDKFGDFTSDRVGTLVVVIETVIL